MLQKKQGHLPDKFQYGDSKPGRTYLKDGDGLETTTSPQRGGQSPFTGVWAVRHIVLALQKLQGYLTYKNTHPPKTLPSVYA